MTIWQHQWMISASMRTWTNKQTSKMSEKKLLSPRLGCFFSLTNSKVNSSPGPWKYARPDGTLRSLVRISCYWFSSRRECMRAARSLLTSLPKSFFPRENFPLSIFLALRKKSVFQFSTFVKSRPRASSSTRLRESSTKQILRWGLVKWTLGGRDRLSPPTS